MENKRYQQGIDIIEEFIPTKENETPAYLNIAGDLSELAPDLDNFIVEFAFGEIYSREGLTNQQRTLVTISSLVTLGTEPQLALHTNVGLNIGLTPKEIVGTVVHLIPYTGFPRVLNALRVVKKVFDQRNVKVED
jgi:4-carboxymuconolactone decarboxylase